MPTLAYRARAVTGEIVEGQPRARDAQALRMSLSRGGLGVLSVLHVTQASVPSRSATPWDRFFKPVRGRGLRWLTGQMAFVMTKLAGHLDEEANTRLERYKGGSNEH